MTDVKVSRKGGIAADGNLRAVGSPMLAGRDAVPCSYAGLTPGQHYIYNINMYGMAGTKMVISFTNTTPSSVSYPIPGDPGTNGQLNRDILLLVQ